MLTDPLPWHLGSLHEIRADSLGTGMKILVGWLATTHQGDSGGSAIAAIVMYGPSHDCKRDRWDEVQSAQMYPALMEMNLRALDEFRACLSC